MKTRKKISLTERILINVLEFTQTTPFTAVFYGVLAWIGTHELNYGLVVYLIVFALHREDK